MPPWAAAVPRSSNPLRRLGCNQIATQHHRNTSIGRNGVNLASDSIRAHLHVRAASTNVHVASTAINYHPHLPLRNKELYDALSELGDAAERFVNLSRLQLALRGLATENAVTRVAVLGISGREQAFKLAQLVFADPLKPEAAWERKLEEHGTSNGKDVLLRYGEENDPQPSSPLYDVLSVQSNTLQTHNIEVLVSSLDVKVAHAATSASESADEAILVPKIQAPSAMRMPVPFPVHKTIIIGEGLESAISFGRFTAGPSSRTDAAVKVAIELRTAATEAQSDTGIESTMINAEAARMALRSIRESLNNSLSYEHKWFASGLPAISQWLVRDVDPASPLKQAHKTLISSILDNVEARVTQIDAAQAPRSPSEDALDKLNKETIASLVNWAEKGHEELRERLDGAFAGVNWARLAWWKLFWRVDDVGMVLEEVLERRWLVNAEKEAVYLAGRMMQAGFPDTVQSPALTEESSVKTPSIDSVPTENTPPLAPTEPSPSADPSASSTTDTAVTTELKPLIPWSSLITTTRTALLTTTIPPLQALAQRLLLTTFSTTSLSAALSTLLYFSSSTISVFEASAVAALGITFALKRMQKGWEEAREGWAAMVREEGRQVLRGVEGSVRRIVGSEKGRREALERESTGADEDGVEERRMIREKVVKVRKVLDGME